MPLNSIFVKKTISIFTAIWVVLLLFSLYPVIYQIGSDNVELYQFALTYILLLCVPLLVVAVYFFIDPKASKNFFYLTWGIIVVVGIALSKYFFLFLGYVYIHIAVPIAQAFAYPKAITALLLFYIILYFVFICNALIAILGHIFQWKNWGYNRK